MKKIIFAMMACVAMFAFTACDKDSSTVETQIFDLSFDKGDLGDGDVIIYQTTYEPIFIAEIAKVAPLASQGSRTFMVNASEKKAKADVKAAFDLAAEKAQKLNDEATVKMTGLKVILKHSKASDGQNQKDFASYTFK